MNLKWHEKYDKLHNIQLTHIITPSMTSINKNKQESFKGFMSFVTQKINDHVLMILVINCYFGFCVESHNHILMGHV
jgi:hypothetical protein